MKSILMFNTLLHKMRKNISLTLYVYICVLQIYELSTRAKLN